MTSFVWSFRYDFIRIEKLTRFNPYLPFSFVGEKKRTKKEKEKRERKKKKKTEKREKIRKN